MVVFAIAFATSSLRSPSSSILTTQVIIIASIESCCYGLCLSLCSSLNKHACLYAMLLLSSLPLLPNPYHDRKCHCHCHHPTILFNTTAAGLTHRRQYCCHLHDSICKYIGVATTLVAVAALSSLQLPHYLYHHYCHRRHYHCPPPMSGHCGTAWCSS